MANQRSLSVETVMKDGEMKHETVIERFNLISGGQFSKIDLTLLSSAQRARFLSWARETGVDIGEKNEIEDDHFVTEFQTETSLQQQISAIGIDVQYASELIEKPITDPKSDMELTKIFSQEEIAYSETRPKPNMTLAGLFAAKEALVKAGLSNYKKNNFSEIDISHDNQGKPVFEGYMLSISHNKDIAVAVAIKINEKKNDNSLSVNKLADNIGDLKVDNELQIKNGHKGFSKMTTILVAILIALVILKSEVLISEFMNLF